MSARRRLTAAAPVHCCSSITNWSNAEPGPRFCTAVHLCAEMLLLRSTYCMSFNILEGSRFSFVFCFFCLKLYEKNISRQEIKHMAKTPDAVRLHPWTEPLKRFGFSGELGAKVHHRITSVLIIELICNTTGGSFSYPAFIL